MQTAAKSASIVVDSRETGSAMVPPFAPDFWYCIHRTFAWSYCLVPLKTEDRSMWDIGFVCNLLTKNYTMMRSQIEAVETGEFFARYLALVPEDKALLDCLKDGQQEVLSFFDAISEERMAYRYAPGKWSIKEVFQHLIDTERVFAYRCFRIARRDTTPLPGFDQDILVPASRADHKSKEELKSEYDITRTATISMVQSLTDEDLAFVGTASDYPLSARAAAFMLPGHEIWHMRKIEELY